MKKQDLGARLSRFIMLVVISLLSALARPQSLPAEEIVTRPIRTIGIGLNKTGVFMPDGSRLLLASDNGAVLMDMATSVKYQTYNGHGDIVAAVACSRNGTRVLTGSWDHTARLWDAYRGTLLRTFAGHTDHVNAVALSPDGSLVLTGSDDMTARLWDAASGALIRTLSGHSGAVTSVAFHPAGGQVLTGSVDMTAKLWDAAKGTEIRTFSGHFNKVNAVVFSADGGKVVTGSEDGTAILWTTATGKSIRTFSKDSYEMFPIRSVAISPDGSKVATIEAGVHVYNAATGDPLPPFYQGDGYSVAFSPDGSKLLVGSDRSPTVLDVATGAMLYNYSIGDGVVGDPTSLAFSPDGSRVLNGSTGNAILWDAKTGAKIQTFSHGKNGILDAVFSPDGKRVLTGSFDKTAKLWDVATSMGTVLHTFAGHTDYINAVAFSPDGSKVLTGSRDSTAKLWDAATSMGTVLQTFTGHTQGIDCVAVTPDGRKVITGSGDHTIKVWEAGTGALIRTFVYDTLNPYAYTLFRIAISPDGSKLLVGSPGPPKLWDLETGDLIRSYTIPNTSVSVKSAALSPDGKKILMATREKDTEETYVRLLDTATGALLRSFSGCTHSEPYNYYYFTHAAFSPDGRTIVTGSNDGYIKLWDSNGDVKPAAVAPQAWRALE